MLAASEDARRKAHERGLYPAPMNEGRSRNMQANRRSDTKPEVSLRRALHRMGYRYRKDLRFEVSGVKVRPDIVFTARKVAVYVDGCFWHVCPLHGRRPTTNEWYWTPKLRRNIERDRAADKALAAMRLACGPPLGTRGTPSCGCRRGGSAGGRIRTCERYYGIAGASV